MHDGNNPIGTRDGDLPHFTHGKKVTLHTFDEVVDHLRAEIQTTFQSCNTNMATLACAMDMEWWHTTAFIIFM